jgi:hypothetical protein
MTGKPHTTRDRIVLLLVNGMSAEQAEGFAIQSGADPETARQVVAEARKRITVAADYTRDEQIGRAVMRLDDLYAKSIAGQDIRTALQAQRELNRLLDLYAGSARAEDASEDGGELRRQVQLIASYLLPLKLADEQYPVEEHARVAAEVIRRSGKIQA